MKQLAVYNTHTHTYIIYNIIMIITYIMTCIYIIMYTHKQEILHKQPRKLLTFTEIPRREPSEKSRILLSLLPVSYSVPIPIMFLGQVYSYTLSTGPLQPVSITCKPVKLTNTSPRICFHSMDAGDEFVTKTLNIHI